MARLLIVDDEPDIYQMICRYARREGYELLGAGEMVCNLVRAALALQRFPGFSVKYCAELCDG